jgi:hypothetical protein
MRGAVESWLPRHMRGDRWFAALYDLLSASVVVGRAAPIEPNAL